MNLEDKINAPIPTTVDPLESLANGDKRRKGDNAGTLAMPRKSKKSDAGKSSGRKGPKKALVFDGPADGSLGLVNLVNIRSDTAMARMLATPGSDVPAPVIVAPVESQPTSDLVPTVAAPAVEAVGPAAEPVVPPVEAAPDAQSVAPPRSETAMPSLGDAESSVYSVATLQINESAPSAAADGAALVEEPTVATAAPAANEETAADAVASVEEPATAPVAIEESATPVVADQMQTVADTAPVEDAAPAAETVAEAPAAIVEPFVDTSPDEAVAEQVSAPQPEPIPEPASTPVAAPIAEHAPTPPVAVALEPAPAPTPEDSASVKPPSRLAIPAVEVSRRAPVEAPKQGAVEVKSAVSEDAIAEAPAPSASTPLSRSEAIARAARAKALSGASAKTPSPEVLLQAARAEAEQRRATEQAKQPTDLYGYWTRAKNGRRFPARSDFNSEQVAESWPNCMLLTCGAPSGNGNVNITQVLRLGSGRRARPGEEFNFTSMITEWMLTIGGEAARVGQPVQDSETFRTPEGTHAYRIVALPLGEQPPRVDHVLCHLTRY